MKYIESEGLYPKYRQDFTNQLVKLMKTGESFRIVAPSGRGKSKYFRYITTSETVDKNYFHPHKIQVEYFDLNRAYERSTEQVIRLLAAQFKCEPTGREVEKSIGNLLENIDKLYLVIDQSELIEEFGRDTIRYLRSLRDQFKYMLGIVLVYEPTQGIDSEYLRYLLEICPIEIEFPALTNDEAKDAVLGVAKKFDIKISDEDVKKIAESSQGSGRFVKQSASLIAAGKTIDEAIKEVSSNLLTIRTSRVDEFADVSHNKNDRSEAQKKFTKNGFLFFSELVRKNGDVVTRDELATLISPDSEGEGVTNQAIDQLMSRVRKAIKKENLPYKIHNKHGVGYYIEGV